MRKREREGQSDGDGERGTEGQRERGREERGREGEREGGKGVRDREGQRGRERVFPWVGIIYFSKLSFKNVICVYT